jgi:hypothetical protein
MRTKAVESPSDRRALAGDAGWGAISGVSVVAGMLVAYAAAALLALAAWGVAVWIGVDTTMSVQDWRRLGELGGIGAGIVLLLAFFFGGYTAGRMARRGGLRNGLLAAVLGIVLAVGIGAAVGGLGGWPVITREVHRLGAPTTRHPWRIPGLVAGIAMLAGTLLGGLIGGQAGERWHTKLLARALDPAIGPEARVREAAAVRDSEADALHRAAAGRVATTTAGREPVEEPAASEATANDVTASEVTPSAAPEDQTLVSGRATTAGVGEDVRQEADRLA